MSIRKVIVNISKKNILFRKILRKILYITNIFCFKISTIGIKCDEKTIIFCSFNGRNYCDSPKAIYEYMINSNEYNDYKFIWVFSNIKKHRYLEKNKNTKIVKVKGLQYLEH